MRILEKTLVVLFLMGIIFKLLHWPGAGPLLVVSLTTLAMVYFILSFFIFHDIGFRKMFKKENFSHVTTKSAIFSIVAGLFGLSTLLTGIMFKIMLWPGSQFMLISAIPVMIVLIILALVKHKNPISKSFLFRALPFTLLGLILVSYSSREFVELTKPGYLEVYDARQTLTEGTEDEYKRKVRWLENKYYYSMMGGIPYQSHTFSDSIFKSGHETYQIILNQENDTLFESAKDFDRMEILDLNADGYEDFTIYDLDGNAEDYIFNPDSNAFVN